MVLFAISEKAGVHILKGACIDLNELHAKNVLHAFWEGNSPLDCIQKKICDKGENTDFITLSEKDIEERLTFETISSFFITDTGFIIGGKSIKKNNYYVVVGDIRINRILKRHIFNDGEQLVIEAFS